MNGNDVALALARHMNQPLTVEVGRAIMQELCADHSIDPAQFGQQMYGGYLIQAERFNDVLPELHRLHELHWAETERYRAGVPMNPNYEFMADRERAGGLLQFTVRVAETGELVGNMRVYVMRDTHAQRLVSTEDTFFVTPEHRGGFMAVRLWQFVERAVLSLGVREIRFSSKLSNGADRMARYLKYRPVEMGFVKVFDDAGVPVKEIDDVQFCTQH